uniref:Uncharacterized protein n=1 Tax=Opuntia streptacantha TaxID=393608 RepID=A0A7C9D6Q4_OPUST
MHMLFRILHFNNVSANFRENVLSLTRIIITKLDDQQDHKGPLTLEFLSLRQYTQVAFCTNCSQPSSILSMVNIRYLYMSSHGVNFQQMAKTLSVWIIYYTECN